MCKDSNWGARGEVAGLWEDVLLPRQQLVRSSGLPIGNADFEVEAVSVRRDSARLSGHGAGK